MILIEASEESGSPDLPAHLVALRERGYEVFAVNPNADEVEGDRCYHPLSEIPGGVDGVVIGTRPERARPAGGQRLRPVWIFPHRFRR